MTPASAPSPFPTTGNPTIWPLGTLTAILVCIATLFVAAYAGASLFSTRWAHGSTSVLTVEIPPLTESDIGTQDRRVENALAILRNLPAVNTAKPLSSAKMHDLLEPWLGDTALGDDLPLPVLIDVQAIPGQPLTALYLTRQLEPTIPHVRVDDHGAWLRDMTLLANTLRGATLAGALIMAGTLIIAIIMVCRAGLAINRPIIDLLHIIGASDVIITREFRRHAIRLVLPGSILGFSGALLMIGVIAWLLARMQTPLLDHMDTTPLFWVISIVALFAVPVVACLLAIGASHIAVLRTLERLP